MSKIIFKKNKDSLTLFDTDDNEFQKMNSKNVIAFDEAKIGDEIIYSHTKDNEGDYSSLFPSSESLYNHTTSTKTNYPEEIHDVLDACHLYGSRYYGGYDEFSDYDYMLSKSQYGELHEALIGSDIYRIYFNDEFDMEEEGYASLFESHIVKFIVIDEDNKPLIINLTVYKDDEIEKAIFATKKVKEYLETHNVENTKETRAFLHITFFIKAFNKCPSEFTKSKIDLIQDDETLKNTFKDIIRKHSFGIINLKKECKLHGINIGGYLGRKMIERQFEQEIDENLFEFPFS